MSYLYVHDLTFQPDKKGEPIVDSVGFSLEEGGILGLLGPSGSGKTSLLRLIAGFERPNSGRVLIDGRVLEDPNVHVTPEKRGIGFVFQDLALFPHLNVLENVLFGLHKLRRRERVPRAMEMLEAVQLADFAERSPQELSGGEQQRVALARAMAPRPRLILLDEPFACLDPSLRDDVRAGVRDMIAQEDMTAILVTHDHAEAIGFAEHIGVMQGGRLEQVGNIQDLYHNPHSPFVTKFLGGENVLRFTAQKYARTPDDPTPSPSPRDLQRSE